MTQRVEFRTGDRKVTKAAILPSCALKEHYLGVQFPQAGVLRIDYERSRALSGSIKRSKGGPPYIYNGSERGKRTVSCPPAGRRCTMQRERAAARAGVTSDAWAALQELAGAASLWSRLIRCLFWMRRLHIADWAVL